MLRVSAGDVATASAPSFCAACFTDSIAAAFCMPAESLSTMAAGVPAGASRA